MLHPTAVRYAVLELAEYGYVHINDPGDAFQVCRSAGEGAAVAASASHWVVSMAPIGARVCLREAAPGLPIPEPDGPCPSRSLGR